MKTLVLTITIDVDDTASIVVGSGATPPQVAPAAPTPHAAPLEDIPWPESAPAVARQVFDGMETPATYGQAEVHVAGAPAFATWRCPDHGTPAKTVPGGVSKKTGKAYNAFQVCETAGCERRPGR